MVQRAVARRLEAIDEPDCYDGSYGLRQGRRPHEARHARRERCMTEGVSWIVEADVRGDCDRIERTQLRAVLRQRVNAGRIGRLLGPWRRAGVMAEGGVSSPETGVVHGGPSSPVLATLLLHHG